MELNAGVGAHSDDGLGVLTLSDPASNNALKPSSIEAMAAALDSFESNSDIRAILIRSAGSHFCSGMDLSALMRASPVPQREMTAAVAVFSRLIRRIASGPKPVIAAVTGDLLAGGVGLAGAADLVLALEDVQVQLGELVFGVIPANIAAVLVGRRISERDFRWLALTARRVDALYARQIGLFDEIHPDRTSLEKSIRATVKQLFRLSPEAVRRLKALLTLGRESDPAVFSNAARAALIDLATAPSTLSAITDMAEGGLPAWFRKFRPGDPLLIEEERDG